MDTKVLLETPPPGDGTPFVLLVETLTALELTSEASLVRLNAAEPNLRELRRLNRSALKDVEAITRLVSQIREVSRALPAFQSIEA